MPGKELGHAVVLPVHTPTWPLHEHPGANAKSVFGDNFKCRPEPFDSFQWSLILATVAGPLRKLIKCQVGAPVQGAENQRVSAGPLMFSMHLRIPDEEAKSSSLVIGTTLQPRENWVRRCRREPFSQQPSTSILSVGRLTKAL